MLKMWNVFHAPADCRSGEQSAKMGNIDKRKVAKL